MDSEVMENQNECGADVCDSRRPAAVMKNTELQSGEGVEKDIEKQRKYCWKFPRKTKIRGFFDPLILNCQQKHTKGENLMLVMLFHSKVLFNIVGDHIAFPLT